MPHQIFISLVVQFILSKLDYCNSILVNASCRNLNTLQAVMNTAAHLRWKDFWPYHSSPQKPALAKNSGLNHLQNPASSLQSRHRQRSSIPHRTFDKHICYPRGAYLRSSSNRTFVVPGSRTVRQGGRWFHDWGPRIWNSLPTEVRLAMTIEIFKPLLKTYLFSRSFRINFRCF